MPKDRIKSKVARDRVGGHDAPSSRGPQEEAGAKADEEARRVGSHPIAPEVEFTFALACGPSSFCGSECPSCPISNFPKSLKSCQINRFRVPPEK